MRITLHGLRCNALLGVAHKPNPCQPLMPPAVDPCIHKPFLLPAYFSTCRPWPSPISAPRHCRSRFSPGPRPSPPRSSFVELRWPRRPASTLPCDMAGEVVLARGVKMRLSLMPASSSSSGGTALEVAFGDGRRLRKANEPEANTHQLKQRV